jgi:hypothetical protein
LPCPRQEVVLHNLQPCGHRSDEGYPVQTYHPCKRGPDRARVFQHSGLFSRQGAQDQ